MIKDKKIRVAITKESHFYFFHFYFAHYVKYQTAPFQRKIFELTQEEENGNLFIVSFRGSGKSTILTTSYPIWSILGKQQKKFVLILCQTQSQAKQHMMNLRRELENNVVLKRDLGPFQEEGEWGASSLVFPSLNARITVASSEQSIRGLRHNQHRPDLIICDDVEDLSSTKTREGRNKTYQWLTGEVIPAGDRNTRLVVVGNLLHEDSLLMRIKEAVEKETLNGVFRQYPLILNGQILWPGKYPSMVEVESEKLKSGNVYAWQREYLLVIVPDEEQAIHREWIQYYDELPERKLIDPRHRYKSHVEIRIGVDLAISKRDTADYTAMVVGWLFEEKDGYVLYILRSINKKMSFPETVDLCKTLHGSYKENGMNPTFVIEDVAYQKALPQQLMNEGIWQVKTTRPGNQDKRSRLVLTAHLIKTGKVLFPRTGCEDLINQIVHFGVEKHDDLADAFSTLVLNSVEEPPFTPRIWFI